MVKTLLLILCLIASVFSFGQVKWTAKAEPTDSINFNVHLTAVIATGYKMYSVSAPEDDSLRLSFFWLSSRMKIDPPSPVTALGTASMIGKFVAYSGTVDFIATVKVDRINDGYLEYRIRYAVVKGTRKRIVKQETVRVEKWQ